MAYSTTFGTRKKWSSVAGAFFTISSAMPPSVTTSSRCFIAIGITETIGSTPSTFTSESCSTKRQHGVELALQVLDLVVGNRDARQMRDAADGGGIDGHKNLEIRQKGLAEAESAPQPACRHARRLRVRAPLCVPARHPLRASRVAAVVPRSSSPI
jgi:hypothetical protein